MVYLYRQTQYGGFEMKTSTITLTVLCIILTGSLNVAGQKSFLIKEIQPLTASVSDVRYHIELSGENIFSSYRFYTEEKVRLKNWMFDTEEWLTDQKSELMAADRLENEPKVEDWMIESDHDRKIRLSELVKEEEEEPIPLYDWMTCCEDWKLTSL